MTRRRSRIAFVAVSASVVLSIADASADPVPPRAGCEQLASGAPCVRDDGTPGQCESRTDPVHPERVVMACVRNEHFCDAQPEGASCPGRFGQPSHCRTVHDPTRPGADWHSCISDLAVGTPLGAGLVPAARMTTPNMPVLAPTTRPATAPVVVATRDAGVASRSRTPTSTPGRGCSVGGESSREAWGAMWLALVAMMVGRRGVVRRRRR